MSAERIHYFTEDIAYLYKDKSITRKWIEKAAGQEGFKTGDINLIFCSDEYLHEINVKFLHHNTYTDIITFDLSEDKDVMSGDIFISVERARENSDKYNVPELKEIRRLIIHGILHLAGYRDKTKEEKALMRQKEDYYLSLHP
jgi:rRNA maturation RNase YbeY